ncbi:MAG: hypothetical protein SGJ23_02860, partial [Alphaproteobacteria bacterium]|nr:hypothetical protein [Alphaproteobacteria bacterium]
RAEALPRGMERDAALSQALIVIEDAVKAAPKDARTHARAARLYYLQATTAQIDEVSAPLLGAASRAAAEAHAQSPQNASADALTALIDISRAGGAVTQGAVDSVTRSYAAPVSREGAVWRLEAAARAWRALPVALQQRVIVDSCVQAAADGAFATALAEVATGMPDSGIGKCAASPAETGR